MLQEISRLLDEVDTKTDYVTKKSDEANESFRQLESVALRYLVIARRIGLPENADAAIQKIMQFIVAVRTLDITLKMFQAEMGPIGWATLAASAAITGLSFYELGRPQY